MARRKTLRLLLTLSSLSLSLFTTGSIATTRYTPKPPETQDTAMKKTQNQPPKESPFACNVAGISAERRPHYVALAKKLVAARQEVRELADGYAFRYSAEESTIKDLAEFITYERLCCPFFDLEVTVDREGGPAWLRLRGRDGVKQFIQTEFGIR